MLTAFYFVGGEGEGGKRELAARDSSGVPEGTSENVALQNLSELCCLGGVCVFCWCFLTTSRKIISHVTVCAFQV